MVGKREGKMTNEIENQSEIILYQTEDGQTRVDVRVENETVWLSQEQMTQLFGRERSVITKHIKNIFQEGELVEKSNVQNLHIAGSDKPVKFYNLDVIISVGYRVKSLRGTQFQKDSCLFICQRFSSAMPHREHINFPFINNPEHNAINSRVLAVEKLSEFHAQFRCFGCFGAASRHLM